MQDEPTAHPVAYSRTEAQRKQDDLVAEFNKLSIENAALRARVAELEAAGSELIEEFRSPYIGGIYSTSFENKLERVGALIAKLSNVIEKAQS